MLAGVPNAPSLYAPTVNFHLTQSRQKRLFLLWWRPEHYLKKKLINYILRLIHQLIQNKVRPLSALLRGVIVWSSLAVGRPNGNMVLTVLNLHIIALFRQGSRYKLRTVEIVKRVSDSKTIPRGIPAAASSKALTSLFPRCKTSFLITTSSALNNISVCSSLLFFVPFLRITIIIPQ